MGNFLNGPDLGLAKYEPLKKRGCIPISRPTYQDCVSLVGSDMVVICVLNNLLFDAAVIVDNIYQYEGCTDPNDHRSRYWLLATKDMLKGLSGLE
jgi:hypothetical protein